ncbi:MAG: hypothetical protein V1838_00675 [Patescibacteria group bacterium]
MILSAPTKLLLIHYSNVADVIIRNQTDSGSAWQYAVVFDDDKYEVTLDKEHWQELTGGKTEPTELIKRSFLFLLEREPKESILSSFNLRVISQYFPEY